MLMKNNETMTEILKKLNTPVNNIELAERIIISSLKTIMQYTSCEYFEDLLKADKTSILDKFKKLSQEEIDYLIKRMDDASILPIEKCQVIVQKIIPQKTRKSLASYFTNDIGIEFMSEFVKKYYNNTFDKKVIIADPFLGSARTITKTIEKLGFENIKKIYGIEKYYLSALVGYSAILKATKGEIDIEVIHGDTFNVITNILRNNRLNNYSTDIILTNPPFTRWSNLDNQYRNKLINIIKELNYSKYLTRKDASLQILSMFLVDYLLKDNGLVISVLPASTFYTNSGNGYKHLLKKNYEVYAILENNGSSFSEDSGFKEIMLIAKKTQKINNYKTFFGKLRNEEEIKNIIKEIFNFNNKNRVNLYNLPEIMDRNWSFLFEDSDFRNTILKIINYGKEQETLIEFNNLFKKENIIRGIEMYGTDFFFIPNKFWTIKNETNEYVEIYNNTNQKTLRIKRELLTKVLRKPNMFANKMAVKPSSYALSIPEDLDFDYDLKEYIDYGVKSGTAKFSITAWGEKWYSHIHNQIQKKQPYGNIFLPDKVDSTFKHRGVFANYTENETIATKNFYILKIKDKEAQKLLTLWFNSTIFLSIFISMGKKISDRFIRFLGQDYFHGVIPNINNIDNDLKTDMIDLFDNIKEKEFPPLKHQFEIDEFLKIRYILDSLILEMIGINEKEIQNNIYKYIKKKLI